MAFITFVILNLIIWTVCTGLLRDQPIPEEVNKNQDEYQLIITDPTLIVDIATCQTECSARQRTCFNKTFDKVCILEDEQEPMRGWKTCLGSERDLNKGNLMCSSKWIHSNSNLCASRCRHVFAALEWTKVVDNHSVLKIIGSIIGCVVVIIAIVVPLVANRQKIANRFKVIKRKRKGNEDVSNKGNKKDGSDNNITNLPVDCLQMLQDEPNVAELDVADDELQFEIVANDDDKDATTGDSLLSKIKTIVPSEQDDGHPGRSSGTHGTSSGTPGPSSGTLYDPSEPTMEPSAPADAGLPGTPTPLRDTTLSESVPIAPPSEAPPSKTPTLVGEAPPQGAASSKEDEGGTLQLASTGARPALGNQVAALSPPSTSFPTGDSSIKSEMPGAKSHKPDCPPSTPQPVPPSRGGATAMEQMAIKQEAGGTSRSDGLTGADV